MAIETSPQIRLIVPADATLYREVRLDGLKRDPEAFGSSFEYESDKSLAWFKERIAQSEIFGAFVAAGVRGDDCHDFSRSARFGRSDGLLYSLARVGAKTFRRSFAHKHLC